MRETKKKNILTRMYFTTVFPFPVVSEWAKRLEDLRREVEALEWRKLERDRRLAEDGGGGGGGGGGGAPAVAGAAAQVN